MPVSANNTIINLIQVMQSDSWSKEMKDKDDIHVKAIENLKVERMLNLFTSEYVHLYSSFK